MSLLTSILGLFGCGKPIAEDQWTVATGDDNGKPMIVRFRSDIPRGVDIKQYPHLMAIAWKYEPANEGGMPSNADNNRMVLLEELLDSLETKRIAFLTVAVTCNGVKEWQWYSRDQEETMKVLNSALSGQSPFPIEISQQEDSAWSAYFRFRNSAK
ncbi:DUF695 domain-containing protein [Denitromonas iodatirespirans]|uniref:DUF695 domain-containing protein n=1 Tax=Denitromonas iodatirespirans TaxID=2795389 RepID=A0A944DTM3_DENI1|nr:DUF695 domain-containing protein [Denitromonas iodatirespirans]MBT0964219.1 DUF695 domain-containing protein [Denitromonas iodatirespirans]